MDKKIKIWLWLSIVLTIGGAVLLYPIGSPAVNCIFIVIKIGMLVGLITLLTRKRKFGYYIWALSSIGAVIMTIIKWCIVGRELILAVSIFADVCMPVGAYIMLKQDKKQ